MSDEVTARNTQNARAAQQQAEYEQAEEYLRAEGDLEDQWVLLPPFNQPNTVFSISQLEPLLGLNASNLRSLIRLGVETDGAEGIPGAWMPSPQAGWKVPRRGVVVYMARRRQQIRGSRQPGQRVG